MCFMLRSHMKPILSFSLHTTFLNVTFSIHHISQFSLLRRLISVPEKKKLSFRDGIGKKSRMVHALNYHTFSKCSSYRASRTPEMKREIRNIKINFFFTYFKSFMNDIWPSFLNLFHLEEELYGRLSDCDRQALPSISRCWFRASSLWYHITST